MSTATADTTAVIHAHVHAIIEMLLQKRRLKQGVAITAGDPLDAAGLTNLARAATGSQTDVIHLQFATSSAGQFGLTGINVAAPRDNRCYVYQACRLWMPEDGSRAVIIPQAFVRGHFRLSPSQILHVDGKPKGSVTEGVQRADARLQGLLRRGRFLAEGLDIHGVAQAA
ncbi:MAG: hypothetical protein EOP62_00435 [Sphingomonadales bacterium]|nr:MAG: hypothetical protein EOP62_00435 [Sphingomonadales bacterium]